MRAIPPRPTDFDTRLEMMRDRAQEQEWERYCDDRYRIEEYHAERDSRLTKAILERVHEHRVRLREMLVRMQYTAVTSAELIALEKSEQKLEQDIADLVGWDLFLLPAQQSRDQRPATLLAQTLRDHGHGQGHGQGRDAGPLLDLAPLVPTAYSPPSRWDRDRTARIERIQRAWLADLGRLASTAALDPLERRTLEAEIAQLQDHLGPGLFPPTPPSPTTTSFLD